MKLENQVVSLELSKRLRELGVKQESLFYWENDKGKITQNPHFDIPSLKIYSAFTVAELGEYFLKVDYTSFIKAYYAVIPFELNHQAENMIRMFDIEICAKMLIYLLENKLITI